MLPTEMQQREGRLCFRPLQPKQQDFLGEEGWGRETDPLLFTPYRECTNLSEDPADTVGCLSAKAAVTKWMWAETLTPA